MGEEVRMTDYGSGGEDGELDRMVDWEVGLPGSGDLTPLSQGLIPPELASAFNIKPAPYRTLLEVNRASQNTFSSLRGQGIATPAKNGFKSFIDTNGHGDGGGRDIVMVDDEEEEEVEFEEEENSGSRKIRRIGNYQNGTSVGDCAEDADSVARPDNSNSVEDENNFDNTNNDGSNNSNNNQNDGSNNSNNNQSAKALKRPRLVWTPQLHKRFVDVVGHLGIKNAVPKTIMQMMNVEGLTRENVASHLQKYRLYLKRMQIGGVGGEGESSGVGAPSSSDQLFATTPVPQSLHDGGGCGGGGSSSGVNGHMHMPMSVPYGATMMPMPVMGMGMGHHGGHGHMGMFHSYNGFEPQRQHQSHGFQQHPAYGMMQLQHQRDWSGHSNGSMSYQHRVASNEK